MRRQFDIFGTASFIVSVIRFLFHIFPHSVKHAGQKKSMLRMESLRKIASLNFKKRGKLL